jgi:hypothetical protein
VNSLTECSEHPPRPPHTLTFCQPITSPPFTETQKGQATCQGHTAYKWQPQKGIQPQTQSLCPLNRTPAPCQGSCRHWHGLERYVAQDSTKESPRATGRQCGHFCLCLPAPQSGPLYAHPWMGTCHESIQRGPLAYPVPSQTEEDSKDQRGKSPGMKGQCITSSGYTRRKAGLRPRGGGVVLWASVSSFVKSDRGPSASKPAPNFPGMDRDMDSTLPASEDSAISLTTNRKGRREPKASAAVQGARGGSRLLSRRLCLPHLKGHHRAPKSLLAGWNPLQPPHQLRLGQGTASLRASVSP